MKLQQDAFTKCHVQLDRLTESELQALRLLAEGHTAKSIATATGATVGTINERLRQARRKTGASSSRELARLVYAEKVGNEKIGMAASDIQTDVAPHGRAPNARRWNKGAIVMSATVVAGIAALLALGESPSPSGRTFAPSARQDDILGGMVDPKNVGTDPASLHRKLQSEPRDEAWASRMEAELRDRYGRIKYVSGPVRVTCGSSLCEVAGRMSTTESTSPAEWNALNDSLFKLYQDSKVLGLENITSGFSSTPDKKPSLFGYFRRSS